MPESRQTRTEHARSALSGRQIGIRHSNGNMRARERVVLRWAPDIYNNILLCT